MNIKVTKTTTEEIEIELPICVKVSEFRSYKVLSETEVIEVHVWFNAAQLSQNTNARYILEQPHTVIPESEFQTHLNKAKQIIDEAYNKAVTKAFRFGERNDYVAWEVVVWNGHQPCICRIKGKSDPLHYESTISTHDWLYYSHLRPATPEEIQLLGDKEIHYL